MRIVLLFAALFSPAALSASAAPGPQAIDDRSAVPQVRVGQAICKEEGVARVDDAGSAGMKRLDELPPADHILTVLRTEDGCIKPVIVRHGIGVLRDNPAD